mgnify:CR=1 FL=1
MNYEQAMEYIHAVQWAGHKPGLTRTRTLLAALGDPHRRASELMTTEPTRWPARMLICSRRPRRISCRDRYSRPDTRPTEPAPSVMNTLVGAAGCPHPQCAGAERGEHPPRPHPAGKQGADRSGPKSIKKHKPDPLCLHGWRGSL